MPPEPCHIAMLIDGDNAQPSLIENILAETAKYGIVTTRRIYGDWTTPNMSGWKDFLHSHAMQPVQQFRYTTGKNATDSALIIEAMDLLHAGTVGGFCIVSSDSDYTRLAMRIREQGLFVMGAGRADTPKSFVNACKVFVRAEIPSAKAARKAVGENESVAATSAGKKSKETSPKTKQPLRSAWHEIVKNAIEKAAASDGWADMAAVGSHIRQLDSGFKSSNYGCSKLSGLIQSSPNLFETRKDNGAIKVRLKS